ncbi:FMNH2-dependent dimethyl sulfone monooxygenase [Rhodococcus rhodochrous]|uniref:LLM class flavin-dependent oxidoreductase n=1 Tax=Rhodococcus rhodochrous TaxID=1829 RepID=UPI0007510FDE|nr:LLM class flavin-dependent oxidoreductase [Rhodococcus rhodochrous]MDO1485109.1 LLM class flavin-dependent oxidoreductase [Rhodococcus rhodochrous]SNV10080.1 FMNH2-dependent dimethyl sulfone monooxygenase [Rhodococcus rhodochrous]
MTSSEHSTEFGIFLPISNGGWIVSDTAPAIEATYAYNRAAAVAADRLGFDFVMSQAKWRGYGGRTDHWGRTLESMTMMAGLAEATERVKIWATVHTILFNPAIVAKMFTTLDQISDGRCGMNIVVGSFSEEFAQMGMWPDHLDHNERYRYSDEWVRLLLRLWSEDSVTAEGDYFTLRDCSSRPHPETRPTLICAGRSPAGIDFQAQHCDAAFLSAFDRPGLREVSLAVKKRAQDLGRSIKTYTMATVVLDDTDAAAEARRREYSRGVDLEALDNMAAAYGMQTDRNATPSSKSLEQQGFQTEVVTGSAATVREQIEELVDDAELDGLMLIFPDYVGDLERFGTEVLPGLQSR